MNVTLPRAGKTLPDKPEPKQAMDQNNRMNSDKSLDSEQQLDPGIKTLHVKMYFEQ